MSTITKLPPKARGEAKVTPDELLTMPDCKHYERWRKRLKSISGRESG